MVEAIYVGDGCSGARGRRWVEDHFDEEDAVSAARLEAVPCWVKWVVETRSEEMVRMP